jgi:capsular polysaccharide biosynthesis protein
MASPDTFRPLSPQDFSFFGFEDMAEELEETFQDIGIRSGPLAAATVENAIFIPSVKVPVVDRGPGRTSYEGSLVTHDGQPIDFAQARRRTLRWGPLIRGAVVDEVIQQVEVAPEHEVAEEVIYLGWLFAHFGHFLTESLSRTWFLDEVDPSVKVIFHRKRDFTGSSTTQRILEAFGVPQDRILYLEEPTLLRRVIVPEPLHELHWSVHERMPRRFKQIATQLTGDLRPSDQPVYLSRRLLSSYQRQIVGEFEFEEILRENGFQIAYPETMSIDDQIRLVNQHTHVFSSAGSAAYNILFALHHPTIHFLTADIPRQDYFLLPIVSGADATYCNGFGRGGRPSIKTTPLLADIPRLVKYLDAAGFLKKRLRADLAACGHGMQATFDESWFIATVRDLSRLETLSPELEREAMACARSSWPLSLMLARYYSGLDTSRVKALIHQFADLASAESDVSRLATYHSAVENASGRILRNFKDMDPATFKRLIAILSSRFLIELRPANERTPTGASARTEATPAEAKKQRRPTTQGGGAREGGARLGEAPMPRQATVLPWPTNPIVIGATGGSGTRVPAQMLQRAGVFMGVDLNQALDATPFTAFFDLWINLSVAGTDVLAADEARQLDVPMARSLAATLESHWGDTDASGHAWGWKAGRSLYVLPFLHRQLPDLRFIHLIRDGRDVAFSKNQAQLSKHGPTYLSRDERRQRREVQSIALWSRANIAAAEYGERALGDRYLRIRFEDLCADPVAMTARLLAFTGLDGDVEELATVVQPPTTIGRWREENPRIVRRLERFGLEALRRFGYDCVGAAEPSLSR